MEKTTLQIIADWLALDNKDNRRVFEVTYSDKVLVLKRTSKKRDDMTVFGLKVKIDKTIPKGEFKLA